MKIGKSNKNYADFTKKKVKICQTSGLMDLDMEKMHKKLPPNRFLHKMDIKVVHDGFSGSSEKIGRKKYFRKTSGRKRVF